MPAPAVYLWRRFASGQRSCVTWQEPLIDRPAAMPWPGLLAEPAAVRFMTSAPAPVVNWRQAMNTGGPRPVVIVPVRPTVCRR